jgi:hypothetical protein
VDVRYTPGTRFVAVSGSAVAVLDPAVTDDVLEAVWRALVAGGGVGEVLQIMTGAYGTSLTSIPPFAVMASNGEGVLLAVRGPLLVRVRDQAGTETVSGVGVTTWSERWVPDPLLLDVLAADPLASLAQEPTGRALPIRSGVVTADSVRLVVRAAVPGVEVDADDVSPTPRERTDVDDTFVEPGDVDPGESTTPEEPAPDEPAVEVPASDSHTETLMPPVQRLEETVTEGGEDSYDHLWGPTVLRSVEDAAVRDAEDALDAPSDPRGAKPLIADVPAFGVPRAAPAEPDSADHDGETIMGGQLAAMRRLAHQASPPAPSHADAPVPTEHTVLARLCSAGHPSPPQSARCRVCGLDLVTEARRVPRPPLGRIVLSTGPVIELDRPVVVGRKPRVSRVQGADLPRLVTVPSPQQDISRSHLELRIEEWHVLVADLGTTNGTILQRPGQPHRRLHPNEAVMIRSDDVVDIGEGVTIAFEAIP